MDLDTGGIKALRALRVLRPLKFIAGCRRKFPRIPVFLNPLVLLVQSQKMTVQKSAYVWMSFPICLLWVWEGGNRWREEEIERERKASDFRTRERNVRERREK